MKRNRARGLLLGWLIVVLSCVSVCISEEEVVAEADEIAKKIEEESKKVDAQSDAMVKAIDNNGKNVDDPEQEKKFEEASKRVDDIADISNEEVEDKANKAEEKANEAERRVEELGRRIEANNKSNKRSMITNQTGMQSNAKRRTSVTYNLDYPMEMTAGQAINNVLRDGDQLAKSVYNNDKTTSENTNSLNNDNTIQSNLDSKDDSLAASEETKQDSNYNVFTTDDQVGKTTTSNSHSFFIPPIEDYSLQSYNFIDLQNKLGTQKDNDYDDMNEYKVENINRSQDAKVQETKHDKDGDVDFIDDVDHEGSTDDDDNLKPKRKEEDTETANDEDDSTSYDDIEGSVDSFPNENVDKLKHNSDTTIDQDIQSVVDEVKADANSEATKPPSLQPTQSTIHEHKHRHLHHHKNLGFNNNIPNLKEKKKLFENVEFEMNQRIKEEEHIRKKKERQKEIKILETSLQNMLSGSPSLNRPIDPEMLLRWPSLAMNYGQVNSQQQVSLTSSPEVEFLQTEHLNMPMPHKVVTDLMQERRKRRVKPLKRILVDNVKK